MLYLIYRRITFSNKGCIDIIVSLGIEIALNIFGVQNYILNSQIVL